MSFFGHNIRFWRKREKFSQERFADMLGITRSKLATYESSVEPRYDFLISLADKFRVNIHYFLSLEMTNSTFDQFFVSEEENAVKAGPNKKTEIIEMIQTLTKEESLPARIDVKDALILKVIQLFDEHDEVQNEFLRYLKQGKNSAYRKP